MLVSLVKCVQCVFGALMTARNLQSYQREALLIKHLLKYSIEETFDFILNTKSVPVVNRTPYLLPTLWPV